MLMQSLNENQKLVEIVFNHCILWPIDNSLPSKTLFLAIFNCRQFAIRNSDIKFLTVGRSLFEALRRGQQFFCHLGTASLV